MGGRRAAGDEPSDTISSGYDSLLRIAQKAAHLAGNPSVSITYWVSDHDTATADCRSSWITDDDGRAEVWRRFAEGPEPVGYDPAIIPVWADGPTSARFAGLRLEPWRLRVQPAAVMLKGAADLLLTWSA